MGVVQGGQDIVSEAANTMVGDLPPGEGVEVYEIDVGPGRFFIMGIVCVVQLCRISGG